MPGSPGSSWAIYKARLGSLLRNPDAAVLVAFWLFGENPLFSYLPLIHQPIYVYFEMIRVPACLCR